MLRILNEHRCHEHESVYYHQVFYYRRKIAEVTCSVLLHQKKCFSFPCFLVSLLKMSFLKLFCALIFFASAFTPLFAEREFFSFTQHFLTLLLKLFFQFFQIKCHHRCFSVGCMIGSFACKKLVN